MSLAGHKMSINPDVFNWAWVRAGNAESSEIQSIRNKIEKANSPRGRIVVTRKQARNAAKKLNIPLAYFYLDKPPLDIELPIPDFRKPQDAVDLSFYGEALISDIDLLQDWYRNTLIEQGMDKLSLIGSISLDSNVIETAKYIYKQFNFATIGKLSSSDELLKKYVGLIEEKNINVLISGHYKNFNRKPIEVREYRGFAMVDEYAPIIFINNNDTKEAQIFTLIHELIHILLGESGISDNSIDTQNKVEIFCNHLAAETLAPAKEIGADFRKYNIVDEEVFLTLAKKYSVSALVIARRALDLKFIDVSSYQDAKKTAIEKANQKKAEQKSRSASGPPPKIMLPRRYGKNITATIQSLVRSNQMSATHAMRLIGASQNFLFGR